MNRRIWTLMAALVLGMAGAYTVQKGDTLFSIASANGLTVDELRRLNNLKDNAISVGQVLRLSGQPGAAQPTTANTALRALLRRDQLKPTARLEVFAALAEHFRSLVKLPEEIATDLSDEALVRAVVDVVFAKPR